MLRAEARNNRVCKDAAQATRADKRTQQSSGGVYHGEQDGHGRGTPKPDNMRTQRNTEKQARRAAKQCGRKEQQPHLDTPPVGCQHNDSLTSHCSEQRHGSAARASAGAAATSTAGPAATAASSPHGEATKGEVTENESKKGLDVGLCQKNGVSAPRRTAMHTTQAKKRRLAATSGRSEQRGAGNSTITTWRGISSKLL